MTVGDTVEVLHQRFKGERGVVLAYKHEDMPKRFPVLVRIGNHEMGFAESEVKVIEKEVKQ